MSYLKVYINVKRNLNGINKQKKKALIEKYNQEKLRNHAMKMGVTLISPETVFLSNDTKFGKNVVINPYVVIGKKTKIGNSVEILPFTHIENAILESNVNVGTLFKDKTRILSI